MGEVDREVQTMGEVEEKEDAGDELEIWRYVFGFADIGVVKCAVELGIADVLQAKGQAMTLTELSAALDCDPSQLFRIMRFLVQRRVFGQTKCSSSSDGGSTAAYTLTPISRRLVKNGEGSLADLVLFQNNHEMLAPWNALSALVSGRTPLAFEMAYGEDLWRYLKEHPAHRDLLNNAMACNARAVVPAVVSGCPGLFDGVGTVVDVGGGNGTAMRTLVGLCPWIKAISFDLPEVVDAVPKEGDVVEYVGGSMFVDVPKADAVFIKWVLHDWGDEDCVKILKKCKEAIPGEGGKVIIVEAVVSEEVEDPGQRDIVLMLDMALVAHVKGKERTKTEWNSIISKAGFSRYTIKPIQALQSVIEVFP